VVNALDGEMASSMRIAVIAVFLVIWGSLNFYLGWRGWQYFGSHILDYRAIYWGMLVFLAASYFLGRWGNHHHPGQISDSLIWIGSYWMAFLFYALIINVLLDLIKCMDKAGGFLPAFIHDSSSIIAILVVLLLIFVLIYGTYNAKRPVVNQYRVNISKEAGMRKSLHIVMVSDIHLGNIVGRSRLSGLVDRVNLMQPELVLLVGDIIDGDIRPFEEQQMAELMRTIKAPQGVFAVLGNHEYLGGQYMELVAALESCGVTVLRDQYQLMDNFYLVGRDDKFSRLRKPLEEVMTGVNHQLPIILMDHNPIDIEESRHNRVDLQLSGHTHAGQLYPLNLFTKKIFVLDWGYLRQEDMQIIVSNGFGTWGPPIRIGNRPEIVEIFVQFGEAE
jgi:predicted MPP superfamily phosphohydrolase